MTKSNTLSKTKDDEVVKKIYTCQDCGHTFEKEEKINFPKDDDNTSGRGTHSRSSYNHTSRGGSFGGGSFGGGGAGSRF